MNDPRLKARVSGYGSSRYLCRTLSGSGQSQNHYPIYDKAERIENQVLPPKGGGFTDPERRL